CFCHLGCGWHVDAHSLPTRRSSDLVNAAQRSRLPGSRCSRPMLPLIRPTQPSSSVACAATFRRILPSRSPPCCRPRSTRVKRLRSEEHTSELQSRENLVCRLMLEKK